MNPLYPATLSYEFAGKLNVTRKSVKCPALRRFYFRLKKISRDLGEERKADCWQRLLAPLTSYRFNLCSAPLPPSYLGENSQKTLMALKKVAESCIRQYPYYTEITDALIQDVEVLFSTDDNPLLSEVRVASSGVNRAGLVVVSLRNFERITNQLKNNKIRNVEPVSLTRLRRNIQYDLLIYIGSTSWLSDAPFIFSAPRTPHISLIHFSWLKSGYESGRVFQGRSIIGVQGRSDNASSLADDEVDGDDFESVPVLDVSKVVERAVGDVSSQETYEIARARLFILAQSYGVFLDVDSESKVLVIDRSEDSSRLVRSLPPRLLRPGTHLVLKTSEGGDYILPVADRILGPERDRLRQEQSAWKARLLTEVKKTGFLQAALSIIDCGSKIANEMNLRNWLSPRGIKTQKKSEFAAIMKFIGLDQRTDDVWRDMNLISRAHRKAGSQVKKEMIEKLNQANIEKLEQEGKLSLDLPGMDVGTLTAFRVESVSDKIIEVPFSKLAAPFDLEEFEWQE